MLPVSATKLLTPNVQQEPIAQDRIYRQLSLKQSLYAIDGQGARDGVHTLSFRPSRMVQKPA